MIAKLSGRLDSVVDGGCVIDVGGVGYLVFCSGRTLQAMPEPGGAVSLMIETQVREDHIHLFGFTEAAERDWFNMLLGVQGVGARVALGMLSVLSPGEIAQAIVAQDKTTLTRAPNVGPKLAARICSELKDKAGKLAIGPGVGAVAATRPAADQAAGAEAASSAGDAVSALVNLGYRQVDAFTAVQDAAVDLGPDADLQSLIRISLKALAR
jgi:Holliday junction DNA helicase RuvA